MSFSKRYNLDSGIGLQIKSIDKALQNRLWNTLYTLILESEYVGIFCREAWKNFFKLPIDELSHLPPDYLKIKFKAQFYQLSWDKTYDLIEFVCAWNYQKNQLLDDDEKIIEFNAWRIRDFIVQCNDILQQENSAYRIINNIVSRNISESECQAIEKSINIITIRS